MTAVPKEPVMKKWKNSNFYLALKSTHLFRILAVFMIVYWIIAYLIYRIDPSFDTFGESMWYCFELISTIGFGEAVAITAAGKVLSVCLSFFSIAVIAIITSTIVNYYHLALRRQEDTDMIRIMKKLEHLEELEKEELAALSKQFREWHS